jgi:hypothetical protein
MYNGCVCLLGDSTPTRMVNSLLTVGLLLSHQLLLIVLNPERERRSRFQDVLVCRTPDPAESWTYHQCWCAKHQIQPSLGHKHQATYLALCINDSGLRAELSRGLVHEYIIAFSSGI